jgi:8-oxo-dGTP pyrophosphatase MutT (NUDIX family)
VTEAAVPVRPAATVLLLRDAEAGLEVFMVRRHRMMGFAGDALVFPGGRLDEADAALAARTELCVLPEGLEAQAAVFRVGALRETFEESGVLLARDRSGKVLGGDRLHRFAGARASVAAGSGSFADFLARENIVLAADLLIPFAHWITPPVHAKRYDTMFFLAAAPPGQTAAHDGTESVDSLWITAADALAAAAGGAARVEFATRRNLEKLGRFPTVAAALAAARRARIYTVLPVIEVTATGRIAHLPPEADYGGTRFDFT